MLQTGFKRVARPYRLQQRCVSGSICDQSSLLHGVAELPRDRAVPAKDASVDAATFNLLHSAVGNGKRPRCSRAKLLQPNAGFSQCDVTWYSRLPKTLSRRAFAHCQHLDSLLFTPAGRGLSSWRPQECPRACSRSAGGGSSCELDSKWCKVLMSAECRREAAAHGEMRVA